MLLRDRHIDLAQYVGYDLWLSERQAVDDSGIKGQKELEKKKFMSGLSKVHKGIDKFKIEQETFQPSLRTYVDLFYFNHLLGEYEPYVDNSRQSPCHSPLNTGFNTIHKHEKDPSKPPQEANTLPEDFTLSSSPYINSKKAIT